MKFIWLTVPGERMANQAAPRRRSASQYGVDLWWTLPWLSLTLVAVIGMDQVSSVIAGATPPGGLSVSGMFGIKQLWTWSSATTVDTFSGWWMATVNKGTNLVVPTTAHIGEWLIVYLLFNLFLVVGYTRVLIGLVPSRNRWTRGLLYGLVALDAVRILLAAVAALILASDPPGPLIMSLHIVTMVKWLAALVLLIRLAYLVWDSNDALRLIGDYFAGLLVQRFSLIVVALLSLAVLGPGTGIFEQFPDVERSWLAGSSRIGWLHLAVAALAQLLLVVLLLAVGRMRTQRARVRFAMTEETRREPRYLPWVAFPAGVVLLALVLWGAGIAQVDRVQLGVLAGVPLLIAVSSLIAGRIHGHGHAVAGTEPPGGQWRSRSWLRPGDKRSASDRTEVDCNQVPWLGHDRPDPRPDRVDATRAVGDGLAIALITVTGFGLVRAFTAAALLTQSHDTAAATVSWVAVVIGVLIAAFSWPLAGRLAPVVAARLTRKDDEEVRPPVLLAAGLPLLLADVALVFWPVQVTHWVGVLGTVVIAFSTLAVVLGMLAYFAQMWWPLPVFRLLRLNVTPVISVIVVIGVLGALVNSRPQVHQARGPVPAVTASSGALAVPKAVENWIKLAPASCAVRVTGADTGVDFPVYIQPLFLVAAAGGGIRAAWWTEQALSMIGQTACGKSDVFAVSSVSGGSVGLTILQTAENPGAADSAMKQIAGPDALAAAMDGLLLHDTIAGYTGLDLAADIPAPAGDHHLPAGAKFSDRAGLMETVWQREDEQLAQPFPLKHPLYHWHMLLNSAVAGSGCRAILSDLDLSAAAQDPQAHSPDPPGPEDSRSPAPQQGSPAPLGCDLRYSVTGGGGLDFFKDLPCQRNIAAVTAAMLSARFPFITPSGVVIGCHGTTQSGQPAGQLIDGGYVDGTGLMTLGDILPEITETLSERNADLIAHAKAHPGRPAIPVTLVVPMVVYLGNGPRPDPMSATSGPSLTQEPLVPVHGKSDAGAQLSTADTLLQRLMGISADGHQWLQCTPPTAKTCASVAAAAEKFLQDQTFFVAPRVAPDLAVPLGWELSTESQETMNSALRSEAESHCRAARNQSPYCEEQGVGLLGDLIWLLNGTRGS